jgi:deoxyhypusine synthase
MQKNTPNMLEWMIKHYHHYNAGAVVRATIDYWKHYRKGGKMFWTVAGAMSSAQLGITMAPAIRKGLIHALSVTGANLEESLFRLVADSQYFNFPNYRYLTKEDDQKILEKGMRRVTDMTIPEEHAFRRVEQMILPIWQKATEKKEKKMWHEFFFELLDALRAKENLEKFEFEGKPEECWLLAAREKNLPIVVPGFADSTFGNIFSSYCFDGTVEAQIVRNDVEQFMSFTRSYLKLSEGSGLGFFQIGGGIAGDFPICVVPSLKYDYKDERVRPWAYFCQISDSTTSYGSYSGATPNEKITWDKLTPDTPMHVVESDATIVVPMMLSALLWAVDNPEEADNLILLYEKEQERRIVQLNGKIMEKAEV